MIVLDNPIFILATCMRKFIRMKDFCYYDSFRHPIFILATCMRKFIRMKNIVMIVTGNPIFILTTCMRKSTRMKSFCFYDSYKQPHIFILATCMRKSIRMKGFCSYDSYRQPHINSSNIHEKINQNIKKFLFL